MENAEQKGPGVRLKLMQNTDPLKALGTLYLDIVGGGRIAIEIRILQSKQGNIFFAFPSRKGKDEKYHDQVAPVDKETRLRLQKIVCDAYDRATAGEETKTNTAEDDDIPF